MTIVVPNVPIITIYSNPTVPLGSELVPVAEVVVVVVVGMGSVDTGTVIFVVSKTVVVTVSLEYIPIQYGFS
jgi:hypothetical protein